MDFIASNNRIIGIIYSADIFHNIDKKSHQKTILLISTNSSYESKKRLLKVQGSIAFVCGIILIILSLL